MEKSEIEATSNEPAFTMSGMSMQAPKKIDFSKVETLNELLKVLDHMGFYIHNPKDERYDDIRHLLVDTD